MHLLNTVCSQLVPQTGISRSAAPSAVNVDEKLSSLFDHDVSSSVPAQAFEQLFGAHRYDVDSTYTRMRRRWSEQWRKFKYCPTLPGA